MTYRKEQILLLLNVVAAVLIIVIVVLEAAESVSEIFKAVQHKRLFLLHTPSRNEQMLLFSDHIGVNFTQVIETGWDGNRLSLYRELSNFSTVDQNAT